MGLSKKDQDAFKWWAKSYFREQRETTTKELYDSLSTDNPKLAKKIEQAAKKMGAKAYIGRYLLRSFTNQGWLKYDEDTWITQPAEGYCTYCFKELEPDIYMIDIDGSLYCNDDCFFDAGAVEPYDGYWNYYMSLFYEFRELMPEIRYYAAGKVSTDPLDQCGAA